jgi:alpha,alpha-trehalase
VADAVSAATTDSLGLYAEEFDADTAHHLGNFPQAFSHLALIEAAARIILIERVREVT